MKIDSLSQVYDIIVYDFSGDGIDKRKRGREQGARGKCYPLLLLFYTLYPTPYTLQRQSPQVGKPAQGADSPTPSVFYGFKVFNS
jgi:hypothetical protein